MDNSGPLKPDNSGGAVRGAAHGPTAANGVVKNENDEMSPADEANALANEVRVQVESLSSRRRVAGMVARWLKTILPRVESAASRRATKPDWKEISEHFLKAKEKIDSCQKSIDAARKGAEPA